MRLDAERARFERWAESRFLDVARNPVGTYFSRFTDIAWQSWKAATEKPKTERKK